MTGRLAWKNLWRNPRRTLITMTSVSFAVMFAIVMESVQKGAFDRIVENVVTFYYGYVQVHQKGYWDEQILENSFEENDSLTARLASEPHITAVVPRIETFALASAGTATRGCMVVGTIPANENKLTMLAGKVVRGNYLQQTDKGALLAEGLAKRLGLTNGDTLVLLGQGYRESFAAGKFPVKGIVHFGSPELNDGMVYLALPVAQQWLNAEKRLTSVALAIDKPVLFAQIQQQLAGKTGAGYEVMNWQQMMPEISNHIKADGVSMYIFTGVLYMIVGFGIFGTVLMMTAERKFEFGMLIAIGMRKGLIARLLLIETVYINLMGVMLGAMLSLPVVFWFHSHPIRFTGQMAEAYEMFGFEALMPAAVSAPIFFWQAVIVLVIAFIAGLYPVLHIRKLNPAAMRQ